MLNAVMLSGILLFSGQTFDFPAIWKKVEGKWSYVGQVKEKKQILAFETLNKVFESTESLNTEKPNYEVISVLQECVKQNSNIIIILEDGKEQTLRPSDSKQVLLVFDNLNESNQTDLINRLVKTSTNFFNTIEFCLKFKERYT